jgi:hypothetical protein
MKQNFYHVKFITEYNNKKVIFSVDNIEAGSPQEAHIYAIDHFNKNVVRDVTIIMKRKKGQKCKDI